MKKLLLSLALSSCSLASVQAGLIWYEGFNYADGPTTNVSAGVWAVHNSSGANDSFIRNNRLEVSGNTSTNAPRQSDVNRRFCTADCAYTNGAQIVYASFTIICTNLPTAVSNYIAHFNAVNGTQQGRVFAMLGTLPGTWRLGISAQNGAVNQIYPVDLARDVPYQVVVGWNPTAGDVDGIASLAAKLWVNPISSADASVITGDAATSLAAAAYAFRQAAGNTSFFAAITNLAVATTFDEAATNIWPVTPTPPQVVIQPQNTTNFVGAPVSIWLVAAGQGPGNLTYQWVKDGNNISNPAGNTNVYSIASLAPADVGEYQVVVANPSTGLSVTSQVAFVAFDPRTIPPFFVVSPKGTTNFFGQTAILTASAAGPQPITYQWTYNGGPITSPNVSGADSPTLTITGVHTNNGTAGNYAVIASNQYGPSTNASALVAAVPVPPASIGYLRTLVDPVFFLPTNTTALYTVTGIVTTHTNITTSGNCSFYMQDDTGGINVFFGGSSARPAAGDSVTVTGPLGQFNSLLELNLTSADPAHSLVINSSGNLLPPGQVLPLSFTNGVGFGGVGESIRKFQGLVVTFTNVYFPLGFAGTNVFAGGVNYTMTNQAGETFAFRVDSRVFDIIGQSIPSFAWTVTGPMGFFLGTGTANRSGGYQLLPTRYADIVTTEPPPATTSVAVSGNGKRTLSWEAVPYSHSYSVLTSPNVAGPYAPQYTFQTTLLGTEEVPANRSTATGFGSVVLSTDQSTITVNMSFAGLTAPATASHIHGPAGPGTNTSVVFPFTGVPAATSGTIPEQSFAITPTQLGYLTNGLLYMNVHNTNFPGGEIRGQLTAVPSTGRTFATTNGTYVDLKAQSGGKYYRVTSP
jgi:hypothetical protein